MSSVSTQFPKIFNQQVKHPGEWPILAGPGKYFRFLLLYPVPWPVIPPKKSLVQAF